MPRATVAPSPSVGPYPALPLAANAVDLVETAANTVDKNQISWSNAAMMIVFARNTNAGAQTVTINSSPDGLNRTGDISGYSIGAGEIAHFELQRNGWRQSDNYLYLEASHADVKFSAILI